MSSNNSTPYYYKSPARRQGKDIDTHLIDKGIIKKPRTSSKSPTINQQTAKQGESPSIMAYVKLIEELKGISTAIDEAAIEITYLVEVFNKKDKSLKTEDQKIKADKLREKYGIPHEISI